MGCPPDRRVPNSALWIRGARRDGNVPRRGVTACATARQSRSGRPSKREQHAPAYVPAEARGWVYAGGLQAKAPRDDRDQRVNGASMVGDGRHARRLFDSDQIIGSRKNAQLRRAVVEARWGDVHELPHVNRLALAPHPSPAHEHASLGDSQRVGARALEHLADGLTVAFTREPPYASPHRRLPSITLTARPCRR